MATLVLVPLVAAAALFMENLDATVIATSLPAIARDLHLDPVILKLAFTSYLIALAVFIPVSGWAADRFGARNVFRGAIVIFTLASAACGFADSLEWLVAARAVQGLGGAMMTPVGRLILLRSVPKSELVQALAYLTIPALIAPLIGPLVGGFITTYFHWRWIFWINIPVGILGLVLATRYMPDVRADRVPPLDWLGFCLSGLGLSAIIFGFTITGGVVLPRLAAPVLVMTGAVLPTTRFSIFACSASRHSARALSAARCFASASARSRFSCR
jgi:EmrB/QacA subfamily drug resistance transporter